MYSASFRILIHSGSSDYIMSCLHERQKCQQPAPMSHGYTVSRKDCLTAHRNHPCMFPLALVKNRKNKAQNNWSEGLKWIVTLLFGDEKPKLNTHSGCPLPPLHHAHTLLSTCQNDPGVLLHLLPINLRQPRGVWKKACLSQPLQTQQACEEPR